jgi:hypothetical protein
MMAMDTVDFIMAWEMNELSAGQTVEFFAKLVKDGTAWTLQGAYGRYASRLIELGYIDREGNILQMPD